MATPHPEAPPTLDLAFMAQDNPSKDADHSSPAPPQDPSAPERDERDPLAAPARAPITTQLPVVTLGKPAAQASPGPQPRRVVMGRVPAAVIAWPIYGVMSGAGLLAALAATPREWSLGALLVTWLTMTLWVWMYFVAWTYRRRWLKRAALWMALGMQGGMAAICLDRAQPQWIHNPQLVERAALPMMRWAGIMLLVGALLLLAHGLYLGRGYRAKRLAPHPSDHDAPDHDAPDHDAPTAKAPAPSDPSTPPAP